MNLVLADRRRDLKHEIIFIWYQVFLGLSYIQDSLVRISGLLFGTYTLRNRMVQVSNANDEQK